MTYQKIILKHKIKSTSKDKDECLFNTFPFIFVVGGDIMGMYIYNGPVLYYGKVISNNWRGKTHADSIGKATSNLKYQFKKQANLMCNVGGITLTADVILY